MFGLIVCLFLSVAGLQQISATNLQDETQHTLDTLRSLPTHCTKDMHSLIAAEQRKLPGQIFYCSYTSIGIDLVEILVDTAFNGFEAYEAIPAFRNDLKGLKGCLNETSVVDLALCVTENLPATVQAVEVIIGALENYVGEMKMIVPLVVEEIQDCFETSFSQYEVFLESLLTKAKTCA